MGPASAAGAGAAAAGGGGPTARRPRRPRHQHRPTHLTLSAAAVAATAAASLAWTAEGAGGIVAGGYCSRHSRFPGGPTTASSTACASFVPPVPRAAAAASWARPRHHLCPSPAAAAPAPSALSQRRPVAARPWALGPLAASTESAPDAADAVDDADAGSLKGFLRKNVLLGIEPSPDVAAILVVYFVQGAIGTYEGTYFPGRPTDSGYCHSRYTHALTNAPTKTPGLARLATTFYLKDDLGLSPAESAALSGIFSVPWLLKVREGLFDLSNSNTEPNQPPRSTLLRCRASHHITPTTAPLRLPLGRLPPPRLPPPLLPCALRRPGRALVAGARLPRRREHDRGRHARLHALLALRGGQRRGGGLDRGGEDPGQGRRGPQARWRPPVPVLGCVRRWLGRAGLWMEDDPR